MDRNDPGLAVTGRRLEKYPVTARALNPSRKQPVRHPWSRGFPNNERLAAAVKKLYNRRGKGLNEVEP
jgi:hypothetical protein